MTEWAQSKGEEKQMAENNEVAQAPKKAKSPKQYKVLHTMLGSVHDSTGENFLRGEVFPASELSADVLKRYLDLQAIAPYYGPASDEDEAVEAPIVAP